MQIPRTMQMWTIVITRVHCCARPRLKSLLMFSLIFLSKRTPNPLIRPYNSQDHIFYTLGWDTSVFMHCSRQPAGTEKKNTIKGPVIRILLVYSALFIRKTWYNGYWTDWKKYISWCRLILCSPRSCYLLLSSSSHSSPLPPSVCTPTRPQSHCLGHSVTAV